MDVFLEGLSSVEFWKFAMPLFGAIMAWFGNEWRKRIADQYNRKESNYRELISSLRGFYRGSSNVESPKREFLNQLNLAWLYCPDHVIKKGYAFLETVHAKNSSLDDPDNRIKENALGEFVAAIRRDFLSRKLVRKTSLTTDDFRHLGIT